MRAITAVVLSISALASCCESRPLYAATPVQLDAANSFGFDANIPLPTDVDVQQG